MKVFPRFMVFVFVLLAHGVRAEHRTLSFDDFPFGASFPQVVSTPGFHITGGVVSAYDGTANRFYISPDPLSCRCDNDPLILHTEPGAKNLTFLVQSNANYNFNNELIITDGGHRYLPINGDPTFGFVKVTIPESSGTTIFDFRQNNDDLNLTYLMIDDIEYDFEQTKLFVRLGDETPGLSPNMFEKSVPADRTVKANVALGSVFWLGISEKAGPLEPIKDLVITASGISVPSTAPAPVDDDALYPGTVLSEFAAMSGSTHLLFVAAHLGEHRVTLLPTATVAAPITVVVNVVSPARLGNTGPATWDDHIVKYAHRRGIPPQIIKGVLERETRFNPTVYRYEPFTTDWEEFSPNSKSSNLEKEPYKFYRMETTTLARGAKLLPQDVDMRNTFDIQRQGDKSVRKVGNGDQYVTAWELYRYNDYEDALNKIKPRFDQNWYEILSNVARKAAITTDPQTALNWSAQTTLAASYGIMQILYTSAVAVGWEGDRDGNKNPTTLWDTAQSVAADGGSIPPGSILLRRAFEWNMSVPSAKYTAKNGPPPPEWVMPPVKVVDWEYLWKLGVSQYNGKSRNSRRPTNYAINQTPGDEGAYVRSLKFAPGRPMVIFP
jgi:hypothetical protein